MDKPLCYQSKISQSMKQLFIQSMCLCLLTVTAQAQRPARTHTFNVQYGFAYASDVAAVSDMHRSFTGIGYQYTSPRNWYLGADVQYGRQAVANSHGNTLMNHQLSGNQLYTCQQPGNGMGFFMVSPSMLESVRVVTNGKVYQTPDAERSMIAQRLATSRLNLMLHGGRRWQWGRSQMEAGLTVTGNFYNREVAKSSSSRQAISCQVISTGQVFQNMFDVTTLDIANHRQFFAGGGLHARYQYQLSPMIGLGVQVLASMSPQGLLAQAAPRLLVSLR
jgi:hypothetical protein